MSISRRVDKTTMGHLHNGILLSSKKEENFTLCDSMDGPENIMINEVESRMTAKVGKVRGWKDRAKRKKDSWVWTTVR